MKILQICNYPAWIKVSEHKQPSHHLFGTFQEIEEFIKINNTEAKIRGLLKDGKGYVDFLLWTKEKTAWDFMRLYFLCFKYDLVFDTLCSVTKQLGILFRLFRPAKLVTILHHPPFTKMLRYTRSDAYIFFDEAYRNMAIKDMPKMTDRFHSIRWQPDKAWYSEKLSEMELPEVEYDFIDNGKTGRDHEMMAEAAYETSSHIVLINHPDLRPKNYKEGGCLTFVEQLHPDDITLLHYLSQSVCILIPCKKKKGWSLIGPIGVTSFMDAIALGKPVICSDNLYFADDVRKYGLGLTYLTGSKDSLMACLRKMKDNITFRKICEANMRQYAKDKSIENYSRKLFAIFHKLTD